MLDKFKKDQRAIELNVTGVNIPTTIAKFENAKDFDDVVIDHDENQLGVAANYQDYGKVDLFKNWLQDGLNAFDK